MKNEGRGYNKAYSLTSKYYNDSEVEADSTDKNSLTNSNDLKLPQIPRRHIKFAVDS